MRTKKPFAQPLLGLTLLVFALPASTSYELQSFGFGAGGTATSASSVYGLSGVAGELSQGENMESTTYGLGAGLSFTQQANVPGEPTFTNPASHYNKLHFVIDTGDNPSDTVYALAISTDNFTTTRYVKADNTIGDTLTISDYQSYTDWGGGTGEFVVDLDTNTTYYLKVKAMHGGYTESAYSAVATATTSNVSLTYDLDVSATDSESSAPYTLSTGILTPNTVITAPQQIWIDLETNAENGAFVYLYDVNGGLVSASAGHTISSATGNLSVASEGYGFQVASVTESNGGPLAAVSPYNGVSETVGIVTTTPQTVLNTSSLPITGGRAALYVKAKAAVTTPAASDYADTITIVASASF